MKKITFFKGEINNKILLLFVLLIIFSELSFSQMKNKWVFNDSIDYEQPGTNYFIYPTDNIYKSMDYFDKDNIVVLAYNWGYEYKIRKTSDGGSTWNTIYYDSTKRTGDGNQEMNLYDVCQISKNKIVIEGYLWKPYQKFINGVDSFVYKSSGLIKYTNDFGQNWNTISFDTSEGMGKISMLDSLYGVAGYSKSGKNSLVITEDGLTTYKIIDLPSYIPGFIKIICLEKNYFIIFFNNYSENTSYLYKTDDAGLNWDSILVPKKDIIIKMKFINKNIGFLLYENDFYSTNDGGNTWSKSQSIEDNTMNSKYIDFDFADEINGLIIDRSQEALYTSDGGKNWIKEQLPNYFNSGSNAVIAYPSKDTAFIGYKFYKIYRRTNKMTLKAPIIDLSEYSGRFVKPKGNRIYWEKIEGANKYELISYENDYVPIGYPLASDTVVNDTTVNLDLNYEKQYYFQIRAFNDTMSSELSGQQAGIFTVTDSNTLSSPKILYPKPKSKTPYPSKLTIVWTSDEAVDSYDIKLYKYIALDLPQYIVIQKDNYQDTSLYIENLALDTNQYLKIRCKINDKVSGWTSLMFTTSSQLSIKDDIHTVEKQRILMSPNPATNIIQANLNHIVGEIASIKLYNSLGIELMNFKPLHYEDESNKFIEFDISSLKNGAYFLAVRNKYQGFIGAFIINK